MEVWKGVNRPCNAANKIEHIAYILKKGWYFLPKIFSSESENMIGEIYLLGHIDHIHKREIISIIFVVCNEAPEIDC